MKTSEIIAEISDRPISERVKITTFYESAWTREVQQRAKDRDLDEESPK